MQLFFGISEYTPSSKVFQKPICVDERRIQTLAILSDNIEKSTREGILFDEDILKDLSCKHFKATAFVYDAATTVTKLDNGEVKLVSHYTCK